MDPHSLDLDLNLSPPPWLLRLGELDVVIPDNSSDLRGYLARLEVELTKFDYFKGEMPLSLLLLTNAVRRLREEVGRTQTHPLRMSSDLTEGPMTGSELTISDKKTWMQSAQLWTADHTSSLHLHTKKAPECTEKSAGGLPSFAEGSDREDVDMNKPLVSRPALSLKAAFTSQGVAARNTFVPILPDQFNKCYQSPTSSASESPGKKKNRRCWSPELHRRFIDALDILGGSQAATPKQIRDQMQVIGLTNDEVKSHLQKYRLHIRKFPNLRANSAMANMFSCHDIGPEASGGGGCVPTVSKEAGKSHSGSSQGSLPMVMKSVKCNSTAGSRCQSICEDKSDSRSHSWGGA